MNNLDVEETGNENQGAHFIKNENRKVSTRKSCSRNEPSLLYNLSVNENARTEGFGGTASSSHYIYVDACPREKVRPLINTINTIIMDMLYIFLFKISLPLEMQKI